MTIIIIILINIQRLSGTSCSGEERKEDGQWSAGKNNQLAVGLQGRVCREAPSRNQTN